MEINYAFSFDSKLYPDCSFKQLNKSPIDTYNRLQSAISRFNEVKTPTGELPDENTKNIAWANIKRSAQILNVDLEVENWVDLEQQKIIKGLKNDQPFLVNIKRAFVEKSTNKKIIEGVASSDLFDTFGTKCTKSCLEDMAIQINTNIKESTYFPIILEDTHQGSWKDNLGIVTEARVEYDGYHYLLVIKAELNPDHPFSDYLYNTLKKQTEVRDSNYINNEKFPSQVIGLSINGYVEDAHTIDYDGTTRTILAQEFKYYEGEVEIIIDKIRLSRIAITSVPSNPLAYVHGIAREAIDLIDRNYYKDNKTICSKGDDKMEENQKTQVAVTEVTPIVEAITEVVAEVETVEVEQVEATETIEVAETSTEVAEVVEVVEETVQEVKIETTNLEESIKTLTEAFASFTRQEEPKVVEPEVKPEIDLSNYITRDEHEKLVQQAIETFKAEHLSDISLMRDNILLLNQGLAKVYQCMQSQPENQESKIVTAELQREADLKDAQNKSDNIKPVDKVAARIMERMKLQRNM